MYKLTNQTRYKCEFCPKEYRQAHYVESHEAKCPKNPDNRHACFGCAHLEKKETTGYIEGYDTEYETTYTTFYCRARTGYDGDEFQELYSYKLRGKAILDSMPRAELMPNECELMESIDDLPIGKKCLALRAEGEK